MWRLVAWGAGVWIALLLGIQGVLSTETGQNWVRKEAVALLSEALETEVTLKRLRLSGVAHLALEGLVLYDKACQPFLQVEALEVSWNPLFFWQGIWRGKLYLPVSSLRLVRPQVYLYTECATGLTNIDRLFPPDTTSARSLPLSGKPGFPSHRGGGSDGWIPRRGLDYPGLPSSPMTTWT